MRMPASSTRKLLLRFAALPTVAVLALSLLWGCGLGLGMQATAAEVELDEPGYVSRLTSTEISSLDCTVWDAGCRCWVQCLVPSDCQPPFFGRDYR